MIIQLQQSIEVTMFKWTYKLVLYEKHICPTHYQALKSVCITCSLRNTSLKMTTQRLFCRHSPCYACFLCSELPRLPVSATTAVSLHLPLASYLAAVRHAFKLWVLTSPTVWHQWYPAFTFSSGGSVSPLFPLQCVQVGIQQLVEWTSK